MTPIDRTIIVFAVMSVLFVSTFSLMVAWLGFPVIPVDFLTTTSDCAPRAGLFKPTKHTVELHTLVHRKPTLFDINQPTGVLVARSSCSTPYIQARIIEFLNTSFAYHATRTIKRNYPFARILLFVTPNHPEISGTNSHNGNNIVITINPHARFINTPGYIFATLINEFTEASQEHFIRHTREYQIMTAASHSALRSLLLDDPIFTPENHNLKLQDFFVNPATCKAFINRTYQEIIQYVTSGIYNDMPPLAPSNRARAHQALNDHISYFTEQSKPCVRYEYSTISSMMSLSIQFVHHNDNLTTDPVENNTISS